MSQGTDSSPVTQKERERQNPKIPQLILPIYSLCTDFRVANRLGEKCPVLLIGSSFVEVNS